MSRNMDTDHFSLSELKTYHVGAMQAAAHRALKKHTDALLKDYGITGMQWHIIGAVWDSEPYGANISGLAELLDTTMAFITTNVNLLESKGILIRSSNVQDGRSHIIRVAAAFLPQCEKIEAALRVMLRRSIYSKVTPEELHTYVKVTAKLGTIDKITNK